MNNKNKGVVVPSVINVTIGGMNYPWPTDWCDPRYVIPVVQAMWDKHKVSIVEDLGLKATPTLKFVTDVSEYHGEAPMWVDLKKRDDGVVEGVIHVNPVTLYAFVNPLNVLTGEDMVEDSLLYLFRHECRHVYQYQIGADEGKTLYEVYQSLKNFKGEMDADAYAVRTAANGANNPFLAKRRTLVAQFHAATYMESTLDVSFEERRLARIEEIRRLNELCDMIEASKA